MDKPQTYYNEVSCSMFCQASRLIFCFVRTNDRSINPVQFKATFKELASARIWGTSCHHPTTTIQSSISVTKHELNLTGGMVAFSTHGTPLL